MSDFTGMTFTHTKLFPGLSKQFQFLVSITQHLNSLTRKLEGVGTVGNTALSLLEKVFSDKV